MKIKRVLLDLDDVCNDFTLPALKHVGCDINVNDFSVYNPKWGFNIIRAATELSGREFTLTEFWSKFSKETWSELPESCEFMILFEIALNMVGDENVLICTSPICGPRIPINSTLDCLSGKYLWIEEHLSPFMLRQFSMTPQKHFCADPETLLIDDCDANVNTFREKGGNAVLMPRPWNTANEHARTSGEIYGYLTEEFKKIL